MSPPPAIPTKIGCSAGRAYLTFARENPQHYRLLFGAELAMEADKTQGLRAQSSRALAVLQTAAGPHALLAWAVVHGLVQLRLGPYLCATESERASLEFQVDEALETFIRSRGEVGGDFRLRLALFGLFGCALAFPGAGLEPFPGCVGTQAPTQGPSARPLGTRAPGGSSWNGHAGSLELRVR
ncbi:MAG: WHG domain-containing protein [Fibrobacteres bacterium]|nr:WHG domain-containing protein [Fibrobacterota bacterium]